MRLKRPLRGSERGADVRMVQRALNKAPSLTTIKVDGVYGDTTKRRVKSFAIAHSLGVTSGVFVQKTLDELWPYFDAYGRLRYRLFRPPPRVPALGPVVIGGRSVLQQDLTHATDGIWGYPAFDDGWSIGLPCIAPEDMTITQQSGAQGGDAVYAEGASKIRYWFGHIAGAPATGKRFRKGQQFAVISSQNPVPHLHTGINTDQLIGRQLIHHTDYSHGAPKVGVQLEQALGDL